MLSLDELENKVWLTLGFHGLRVLEEDVPEDDLQEWYNRSQKNVQLVKHMLTLVCNITPESCFLNEKM